VLSIDLELGWGLYPFYRNNKKKLINTVYRERQILPIILQSLEEHEIQATWAAVGAICCKNWKEFNEVMPIVPNYKNKNLCLKSVSCADKKNINILFFPKMLEIILRSKFQNLESHTFTHLYCLEKDINSNDLIYDTKTHARIWKKKYSYVPKALVFPRNQVAFLNDLLKTNIKTYRQNESGWLNNPITSTSFSLFQRTIRFIDAFIPSLHSERYLNSKEIPTTHYIRLNLPEQLWRLHLKKIQLNMEYLQNNKILHFWFHPHNLISDKFCPIKRFTEFCNCIIKSSEKKSIKILNFANIEKCL